MKLLLLSLTLISCATAKKALKVEDRTYVEIKETKNQKVSNFNNALSFLSRFMKDSNHAVKMKDIDSGKIVAKISYSCPEYLNGLSGLSDIDVDFTASLSFKGNRVRVETVAERFKLDLGGMYGVREYPITGKSKTVECQKILSEAIIKGMSSEKDKDNW